MIEISGQHTIIEGDKDPGPQSDHVSAATRLALILTLRLDRPSNTTVTPAATNGGSGIRPLDATEMNRLARWLHEQGRDALALPSSPEALLEGWQDRTISAERVLALVARQNEIDCAVQGWLDLGIWILGRKDAGYPRTRLNARLGESIPPVLFGIGSQHLIDRASTAIVGSRDTHVSVLNMAQDLGMAEAQSDRTVISGGARGVDERAVEGAFLGNGSAVVILGDGLARQIGKRAYTEHLEAGTLALISPYSPDATFSTPNAMGRNRLIYCLADEAIVVASSEGTGGTFVGARDALRRGWGPIWVAPSDDPRSGNPFLLRAGGRPLTDRLPHPPRTNTQPVPSATSPAMRIDDPSMVCTPVTHSSSKPGDALYQAFLAAWRTLPAIPVALPDLARGLSLTPEQTKTWVFLAIERGEAARLTGPVRYVVMEK